MGEVKFENISHKAVKVLYRCNFEHDRYIKQINVAKLVSKVTNISMTDHLVLLRNLTRGVTDICRPICRPICLYVSVYICYFWARVR